MHPSSHPSLNLLHFFHGFLLPLQKLDTLPLIDDFDNMESHELQDKDFSTTSQVVVEDEKKMVSNAYPGQRTEGTANTGTRVRVSRSH